MRPLKVGYVLPLLEDVETGEPNRWSEIRAQALLAEEIGFDTVWVPDELLWQPKDWPGPRGWWECVAMLGAVAASTSRIRIGSWVLSNLHRKPALTAKIAATVDEISGGRFILGLGAGHAGRQGEAFGYPPDPVYGPFEEGFTIIRSLIRDGEVNFAGRHHTVVDCLQRPRGPQAERLPIMVGGRGPRMLQLIARHADIWSWYADERSDLTEFRPLLAALDEACAAVGRDPGSIGRSAGVIVEFDGAFDAEGKGLGVPIRGSAPAMAEQLAAFASAGMTQVEVMAGPAARASIDAMAPVLEALDAG